MSISNAEKNKYLLRGDICSEVKRSFCVESDDFLRFWVREREPLCMKRIGIAGISASVEKIIRQRVTDMSHVDAYLMSSARFEPYSYEMQRE